MNSPALEALPGWARSLLDDERVGHLGLLDSDGRPRVLPVTYAIHEHAAWTAIDNKPKQPGREPARLRWLRARPSAALTVDRYDEDWSQLCWVQLLGTVTILPGPPTGAAAEALSRRYPQYRQDPPPGSAAQARARARAVLAGGVSGTAGPPQRHHGRRLACATWTAGPTSSPRCSAMWSRCSHSHTP